MPGLVSDALSVGSEEATEFAHLHHRPRPRPRPVPVSPASPRGMLRANPLRLTVSSKVTSAAISGVAMALHAHIGQADLVTDPKRRIALLRARVYGRNPDPSAVEELTALLASKQDEVPCQVVVASGRPRPQTHLRAPVRSISAVGAALVLLGLAWGVGQAAGETTPDFDAAGKLKPPVSTGPSHDVSNRSFFMDVASGRVVGQQASSACTGAKDQGPSTPFDREALCRAASAASVARAAAAYRAGFSARSHD